LRFARDAGGHATRERDLTPLPPDELQRLRERMQRAWLAILAAGALSAAMPAAARDLPYCIRGCDFGAGAGDCSFSSLAQCQATASGRDAYCAANPYFNARAEMKAEMKSELSTDRSRPSRRRF
jgi:hypothetical protein